MEGRAGHQPGSRWNEGRYLVLEAVGNGAFGTVWRAVESSSGHVLAIKRVALDDRYQNRELSVMQELSHPNVVRLHDHFLTREEGASWLHIVMDYVPSTLRSLQAAFAKQHCRFPPAMLKIYMYQLAKALSHMHSLGFAHRDLKPDNVLCCPESFTLQLCDFGCSKRLVPGKPNIFYICALFYRAPELLLGSTDYSVAVDMWSFGCVLAELILGCPLFANEASTYQQLLEVLKVLGSPSSAELSAMKVSYSSADLPALRAYPWQRLFPSGTAPEALELTSRLLTFDPTKRITASDTLQHALFRGVSSHAESLERAAMQQADAWRVAKGAESAPTSELPLSAMLYQNAAAEAEGQLKELLLEPLGFPQPPAAKTGAPDGVSGAPPTPTAGAAAVEEFAARVRAKLLQAGIQAPDSMVNAAVEMAADAEAKRVQRASTQLGALSAELQALYERQRLLREQQRAIEGSYSHSVQIDAYSADLASWKQKLVERPKQENSPAPPRPETNDAACEADLPQMGAGGLGSTRGMGLVPHGSMPAPTPVVSRCQTSENVSMLDVGSTMAPPIGVTPLISRCQSTSVADVEADAGAAARAAANAIANSGA